MKRISRYDDRNADSLDRLIRAALVAAAEKLSISKERKNDLRNRIKREKREFR